MSPEGLQFPVAYYDGKAFFMEPASQRPLTWFPYFGGPLDMQFAGVQLGPQLLHRVLTIEGSKIPALSEHGLSSLPLFYGLRFNGCELEYRFPEASVCQITKIRPSESSEDWPYADYPRLLPYIPFAVSRQVPLSLQEFSKLTWQGFIPAAEDLVVIVPPIIVGGVSIWGPSGDAEGVQIAFVCNFKSATVRASNQCS